MRVVSTRVLPVPAPASTRTGPSVASTASRWASFNSAKYGAAGAALAGAGGSSSSKLERSNGSDMGSNYIAPDDAECTPRRRH